MSDDEKPSDSVGPDIDLEKLASDGKGADGDADDGNHYGSDEEHSHGPDAQDHDDAPAGRTTAPQSEFSTRQAAIGALVTAIGVVVAYVVPALLV